MVYSWVLLCFPTTQKTLHPLLGTPPSNSTKRVINTEKPKNSQCILKIINFTFNYPASSSYTKVIIYYLYSWVLLCFTTTDVGSNFSPFLFITSKLTFALLSSA